MTAHSPTDSDTDRPTDAEPLITPDSFVEIARRLYRGDVIVDGASDDGFVVTHGRRVFVAYHESPTVSIVARMAKGRETVGRHEPRVRTHQNTYVEADVRRAELPRTTSAAPPAGDTVADAFEQGEQLDRGYIHGYRVTPLADVIADIFKWYDQSTE